jgi:hypothetical protein
MERRVKERGASEGRSVVERIGVALGGAEQQHPRREPADFRVVSGHESVGQSD